MASFTNAVNLRLVDGGEQVKQGDITVEERKINE